MDSKAATLTKAAPIGTAPAPTIATTLTAGAIDYSPTAVATVDSLATGVATVDSLATTSAPVYYSKGAP